MLNFYNIKKNNKKIIQILGENSRILIKHLKKRFEVKVHQSTIITKTNNRFILSFV